MGVGAKAMDVGITYSMEFNIKIFICTTWHPEADLPDDNGEIELSVISRYFPFLRNLKLESASFCQVVENMKKENK